MSDQANPENEEAVRPLEELLVEHVRSWLARVSPVLTGERKFDDAVLTLRIGNTGETTDGKPYLSLRVKEELDGPFCDSDSGGTV